MLVFVRDLTLTLLLAAVGAVVARALHLPLAFIVGPTIVIALARLRWQNLQIPLPLRAVALILAGSTIGGAVTVDLTAVAGVWFSSAVAMLVYVVLASRLGRWYLTHVAGYAPADAMLCAQPGGMLVVMTLAQTCGADAGRVLLAHLIRVASGPLVVAVILNLAGYPVPLDLPAHAGEAPPMTALAFALMVAAGAVGFVLARALRIPAAELLGPIMGAMLAGQLGWVQGSVPMVPMAVALAVIGAAVGAGFPRISVKQLLKDALHAWAVLAIVLGSAWCLALLLQRWLGLHPAEFFLAAAPSGLTEMPAIAVLLGLNAAYVAAIETLRFMLCAALASWQAKRLAVQPISG